MKELLKQLDDAVAEVFSQMLDRTCAPESRCLAPDSGFTASVIFSGSLQGNCALHLDVHSAGELAAALTGEAAEADAALSADTVGELCNMIAGSWKSRLEPHLSACLLSTPIVQEGIPEHPGDYSILRSYRFDDRCLTLKMRIHDGIVRTEPAGGYPAPTTQSGSEPKPEPCVSALCQ